MPKFFMGRRQFALGAAAAATTLILPVDSLADEIMPEDFLPEALPSESISYQAQIIDPSIDAKIQAAMAKLSPAAQKEVEMKVASIFRKYGDHLNDDQKADIRRIMAESQEGLEKMRTFKLENGDQPADSFQALRTEVSEDKAHAGKPHASAVHTKTGEAK
jgi:hypothetical protein